MENNYKFYNFDKVKSGTISVKDVGGDWIEILLKNVTAITYLENYSICDNFTINMLKIGVEISGNYHCYHFHFCKDLPVEINGFLCKNFEELDITLENCIPVKISHKD